MGKPIRVLHFTTHDENCGIARYQEHFLDGMRSKEDIYNEIFPYSPNVVKNMLPDELARCFQELRRKLKDFDILHVQYELSFFRQDQLRRVLEAARQASAKTIVTVHTSPNAQYRPASLQGYGLRSWLCYAKHARDAQAFRSTYITPLALADVILVHNSETKRTLVAHHLDEARIQVITHPVPEPQTAIHSSDVRRALVKKSGDVIFAEIGFVSSMKQVDHAVKALKLLPKNYKLAILGGVHPNGDPQYMNQICDLMLSLDVAGRVYISGYVDDDGRLDALIRECDICVYPYEKEYYAYVSSGALSLALGNHKPAIVYPTKSFLELNEEDAVVVAPSFTYYELARAIQAIDIPAYTEHARHYALKHSYEREADRLIGIYCALVS